MVPVKYRVSYCSDVFNYIHLHNQRDNQSEAANKPRGQFKNRKSHKGLLAFSLKC